MYTKIIDVSRVILAMILTAAFVVVIWNVNFFIRFLPATNEGSVYSLIYQIDVMSIIRAFGIIVVYFACACIPATFIITMMGFKLSTGLYFDLLVVLLALIYSITLYTSYEQFIALGALVGFFALFSSYIKILFSKFWDD